MWQVDFYVCKMRVGGYHMKIRRMSIEKLLPPTRYLTTYARVEKMW